MTPGLHRLSLAGKFCITLTQPQHHNTTTPQHYNLVKKINKYIIQHEKKNDEVATQQKKVSLKKMIYNNTKNTTMHQHNT